jgi:mono/diheme cytochrome c family protein
MKGFIFVLAAATALACSSAEEAPKPPQRPPATTEPAPTEPPPTPPAAPRAADATNGGKLYATYCASCHGIGGAGDGIAAAGLDPRPARHDDGAYMNALSNEHLVAVIKLGGPAVGKSQYMAPWGGSLDDQQIRDVVAFTRSLAKPPYEGPQP